LRSIPARNFKPAHHRKFKAALAMTLLSSLVACGGGGGGGGGSAPNSPASGNGAPNGGGSTAASATLSGTAATGAALAGATVTVTDKNGNVVCTTTTDANGTYACDLPSGVAAPLVIRAQRDDLSLYSATATSGSTVANITPLTTIVVSRLSPDGNPASLAGAIQSSPDTVSEASLKQTVAELIAALKPLLDALGDTLDPLSGSFAANGSGHDRVLDAINVSVRPDGQAANIEITVNAVPASDGAAPVSLHFRSDTAIAATLPVLTPEQLPAAGSSQLIAAFIERINACYALPLTQRVRTAANDSTSATGSAQDVIAPQCRSLFPDNDPASYFDSAYGVGRDDSNAGGHAGLFRAGATGAKFDHGKLEYFMTNGDMVVSYRSVDSVGSVDYSTIVLRKDADGALKSPGNGYAFAASVASWMQSRDYVHAAQYNQFSTAYSLNIAQNPAVAKVVVTSPLNASYEYRVNPGTPYMTIYTNGALSSTPNIRLAMGWADAGKAGNPVDRFPTIIANPQLTDAQLSALPNQSAWKMEFFNAGGQSLAVQNYRTIARPSTIAEARQIKLADFTPAMREEMRSGSTGMGQITMDAEDNTVDLSAEGDNDGWLVPEGATAPSTVSVLGNARDGSSFSDSLGVTAALRKAIVPCTTDNPSDTHCDAAKPGAYMPGTELTSFELIARGPGMTLNKSVMLTWFTE